MSQGERRLAAIMFTDMVGYTALTQSDESQAMQVLGRHNRLLRPFFPKYNGKEVKAIGDSFLVEFDSALNATKCAIDLQSFLHDYNISSKDEWKIKLRIGVHLGDVIYQGGDVFGDAINIASRIEPLAEPEGVCISEQVYDQVRNKLTSSLSKLKQSALKNVQFPVDIYKVIMPWEGTDLNAETSPPGSAHRLAVLPFANISPDTADEYFADGMTEELITAMSRLQGLQVIARTSVANYKGGGTKLSTIGNELRVGTVLEGSVRKAGNRVRVTAQLIDVPTEAHLWSERYDRDLDDIFKIQDDIAGRIADALRVRFTRQQQRIQKHTENIEAYTLYLKGRSLWNRRSKDGVFEAMKMFLEATKIDPSYARAYAGLADAYYSAAYYGFMDLSEGRSRHMETVRKALELDDALPEAHASLGAALLGDLKYDEAQRELQRAIELNPGYASAHHWYSMCLAEVGNSEEAIKEIKIARELDPLSPVISNVLASATVAAGRVDEGLAIFDKLIEREPTYPSAYYGRHICFTLKHMKQESVAALETFQKVRDIDEELFKLELSRMHSYWGDKEKALSLIQEVLREAKGSPKYPDLVASAYAFLGEKDEFFSWIDKAIEARNIVVWELRYLPFYDNMKNDPRFPEIFRKLGIPYQSDFRWSRQA